MYKVERRGEKTAWYDVMLSPFKTMAEVKEYHAKYSLYYPVEERIYRVTNLKNKKQIILK